MRTRWLLPLALLFASACAPAGAGPEGQAASVLGGQQAAAGGQPAGAGGTAGAAAGSADGGPVGAAARSEAGGPIGARPDPELAPSLRQQRAPAQEVAPAATAAAPPAIEPAPSDLPPVARGSQASGDASGSVAAARAISLGLSYQTLPGDPNVLLSTDRPAQGTTVAIQVAAPEPPGGALGEQALRFAPLGEAWIALASVAPWQEPGPQTLRLSYLDADGQARTVSQAIEVADAGYPLERWPEAGSSGTPRFTTEQIVAERERLLALFGRFDPQRHWSGPFELPLRDPYRLTSAFSVKRAFGDKPPSWWHEGLDMAAPGGTPVYAPADGVVALAEALVVRGGAVILDHGWGVYSGHYHLSEVVAQPGTRVARGDLIGRVGTTGWSTGNHLHWEIRVNVIYVDPAQWMATAIP